MRIYAEGRLKSDSWTGNDGQTRFRNEIVANNVVFLSSRAQDGAGEEMGPPPVGPPPGGGYQSGAPDPGPDVDAEDLPW